MGAGFSGQDGSGSGTCGSTGGVEICDDSGACTCTTTDETPATPPVIYNNPMGKTQQSSSVYDSALGGRNTFTSISPLHL